MEEEESKHEMEEEEAADEMGRGGDKQVSKQGG